MIANVHFYLKRGKPNKKGEKPIVMRITYNNQRSVIHIGFMIKPKYWAKNQLVLPNPAHEPDNFHQIINKRIKTYRKIAEDTISNAIENGISLSDAYLKNQIKNVGQMESGKKTFFTAMQEYIDSSKSTKAERTIKGYTTTKTFLKDFEDATGFNIDFNTINLTFYDKLRNYAFLEREILDNYFAKIISTLKSFMNWAGDRGYHKNQFYSKFKATEKENEVIFLTLEELMTLKDFTFEKNNYRKARDIFCFGCFTGLRISDILQLTRDHVKNGQIIKSIQKTRRMEMIPINKFAQEIIDRYPKDSARLLPKMSQQKLNQYIKKCCEEAKFTEMIKIVRFSGNQPKEYTYPKHELITSHVARKTFITNSLMLNMNPKVIKEIVGHKKDSTLNKYLKITEQFKADQMKNTWDLVDKKPRKSKKKVKNIRNSKKDE